MKPHSEIKIKQESY